MEDNDFFRISLREEFLKRQKKNPNFSIRAFARSLDIDSSTLAKILNGKRKITEATADELGYKLKFEPLKLRLIKKGRPFGSRPYKTFLRLDEDAFKVIADWHYYAILELTHLDNFRPKPVWISNVLGLPINETLRAIERLQRLNYLEITPQGKWIDRLGDANNLGMEIKAEAFTEHERQVVRKALEALDKTDFNHRVQNSLTFAVSKERVTEAKGMIQDFLEELDEFLRGGETKDEVYNISVSLYPLSDTTGENSCLN